MIGHAPLAGARHAAFSIVRGLVSHALDYDACIIPSCVLQQHVSDLDQSVLTCLAATVDMSVADFSPSVRLQIRLPVRCGGLQLDMPSHTAPLASQPPSWSAGPPSEPPWLAGEAPRPLPPPTTTMASTLPAARACLSSCAPEVSSSVPAASLAESLMLPSETLFAQPRQTVTCLASTSVGPPRSPSRSC